MSDCITSKPSVAADRVTMIFAARGLLDLLSRVAAKSKEAAARANEINEVDLYESVAIAARLPVVESAASRPIVMIKIAMSEHFATVHALSGLADSV